MQFKLVSENQPKGDQPSAIEQIVNELNNHTKDQVLLGITGSGKTFTVANIIERVQRPALVLAHNKTLAAQLYQEFKTFFPENAVEYFVSYYDYYQPEAYVPASDLYIEKEATINDEIDRMRLSATRSLFERRDVTIVSRGPCIIGRASPGAYARGPPGGPPSTGGASSSCPWCRAPPAGGLPRPTTGCSCRSSAGSGSIASR